MVDAELVSMMAFFLIVGILIIRDRKNIQFTYGLVLKKWKKGKEVIDRLVSKRKKLIAYMGTAGVAIGSLASLVGIYFLVSCAFFPGLLPKGAVQDRCFKLVLPSVAGLEKYYPDQVFGIPFWYWLISIFIIVLVHESMHAVLARLEKVPLKSYGLVLFLVLPIGAFVDPDGNRLKRLSSFKRIRIFAAGSMGNILLALLVAGMIVGTNYVDAGLFEPAGVRFNNTMYNTPAYNASLGGTIYRINNANISSVNDLAATFASIRPNDTMTVYTTEGVYSIRTLSNPTNSSMAFIGINGITGVYRYKAPFTGYVPPLLVSSAVSWQTFLILLFVLSLGVGIANMLPLLPYDGGLILEEVCAKLFGKRLGRKLAITTSLIVLALILINLFLAPIKLL